MTPLACEFTKMCMWEYIVAMYRTERNSEREIKETIPFTIALKILKYLGINFPEEQKTSTQKTIRH